VNQFLLDERFSNEKLPMVQLLGEYFLCWMTKFFLLSWCLWLGKQKYG